MSSDTEILLGSVDSFGYSYRATFAHSAVHRDIIMQAQDYVDGASSREYLINIPAGTNPHLVFTVKCNKETLIEFFEDSTASSLGTEIISARLMRSSLKNIATKIYHSPTITSDGTQLPGDFIQGTTRAGGSGGEASIHDGAEWILKTGTNYLVRLTLESSGKISFKAEWYE
jgi:hypothetical protein